MNLYDSITQSDLNDVIDLLLNNYHKEFTLNIDDSNNNYCNLEFDLSEGVDAGNEVIFNDGDELHIAITDKRLALMGYTIRLYYYQLDKADYLDNKDYGALKSFDVKLDSDTVDIPFNENQIYLQKDFDLILLKDAGYRLLLSASSNIVEYEEDVVLTADYTYGSVPVENAEIKFYNGETLIDTVNTDENGLAVLTLSNLNIGLYNFSCICGEVYGQSVNVTVDKIATTISLGASELMIGINENYNLNGVLSAGSGLSVKIYDGNNLVDTVTTGADGVFTKTITATELGTKNYHAIFEGNGTYKNVTSNTVNISIFNKMELGIVGKSSFSSPVNNPFTVNGIAYVDWGDNNIEWYNGGLFAHTYNETDDYTIKVFGNITGLNEGCFDVDDEHFEEGNGLTSITLPNTLTSIGDWCFASCKDLTPVTIPDSVISIGKGCFINNFDLTSIDLGSGVKTIGLECFGYAGLVNIEIPSQVTSIGEYCFANCHDLTEITLKWTSSSKIVAYKSNWLNRASSFSHFNIPAGTTSLYTAKGYPANKLVEES